MEKQSSKFKSPFKSNKYKSFLTSFLSPSVPKRPVHRKDSSKYHSSQSIEDENSCRNASLVTSHPSSDSIYSTVEIMGERPLPRLYSKRMESETSNLNERSQSTPDGLNTEKLNLLSDKTVVKEPLYATVNKKKAIPAESQLENLEIQSFKEDNRILKERIRDLSEDNRLLRKKLHDFMKEEKRKEDMLHSKLQLRITELEAETRRDVNSLSDRIQILIREKESLNDQIEILQIEKKALQIKYDDVCSKLRTMVSPDVHQKVLMEHQKSMNEAKKRHTEEIDKMKELYDNLEESKASLQLRVEGLQSQISRSENKMESLEKTNQELLEEKSTLLEHVEELKRMEKDMQTLLLSLLKVTENIAVERNVLLNKTSFQDHQQKEIQTTVIDYSLNIGRLQEHILNLNKDNHQELMKLKTNKHRQDEDLQQLYGKQLDILRGKILAQHNTINELENDKRKLESQLALIWQAACGTNSKLLEDVKAILHAETRKEKI